MPEKDNDFHGKAGSGDRSQRNNDDLRRKNEIGANGALYLLLFESHQIACGVGHGSDQLLVKHFVFGGRMQEGMRQFLEAFKAQVGTTDHQQRDDQPRREPADRQRHRHKDQLVPERTFGDCPDHRQLTFGTHAGNLLRVERKIVTEDTGRFLCGDLGQQGHIVKHCGNVVE